ncbi:hypothetical protein ACFVTT_26705 [Streptomyces niveus]|uniref:hypothetical protein n=1 Tax=Streptomyces niveus TaxID=193462 RepID=UPI0034148FDE
MDRRRADRPQEDYREPTEQESLGTCGRPYGTPCKHGHACIREARGNGRLGEVEGLQVSLDAATAKLNSLSRAPADGRPQLVDLGMPVFTDPAPPRPREPGEHGARA